MNALSKEIPFSWTEFGKDVSCAFLFQGVFFAAAALFLQGVGWAATGSPWPGGIFAVGMFYGRVERNNECRRWQELPTPHWRNILPWRWRTDEIVDFVSPAIAVIAVALTWG